MLSNHTQEIALENDILRTENTELTNSRDFLKNIINYVADPIFVKDREHRFLAGNSALWNLVGKTEQELIGKSDYDFFPAEQADIFWRKDEEVFRSGKVNINLEYLTAADGKVYHLSTKKNCFKGPDGELRLVGIIRDITDTREQSLPFMSDGIYETEEVKIFHGRILLVEGFQPQLRLVKIILETMGLTVDVASNGYQALEKSEQYNYDIIFMDCQMPEMDGFQTTKAIRKNKALSHHPIIAMTADPTASNEKIAAAGMNDFIKKPIKISDLERMLHMYHVS